MSNIIFKLQFPSFPKRGLFLSRCAVGSVIAAFSWGPAKRDWCCLMSLGEACAVSGKEKMLKQCQRSIQFPY